MGINVNVEISTHITTLPTITIEDTDNVLNYLMAIKYCKKITH